MSVTNKAAVRAKFPQANATRDVRTGAWAIRETMAGVSALLSETRTTAAGAWKDAALRVMGYFTNNEVQS